MPQILFLQSFRDTLTQKFFVLTLALSLIFTPSLYPVIAAEEGDTSTATSSTSVQDNTVAPSTDTSTSIPDSTPSASGTTTITTGDANTGTDIQNLVNRNTIDTNASSSDSTASTTITSTPSVSANSDSQSTTTIANDNTGTVANAGSLAADTGANSASTTGNILIDSGNAGATINVLNVINVNIFNSNVLFLLLNNLFGSFGNLDLRQFGDLFGPSGCVFSDCLGGTDLNSQSTSTASITNDFIVRSSSGENSASTTDGDVGLSTGNAYGAANVVNIANTNLINSNYLLMVFNNFTNWNGDLVFPGKDFFANLGQGSSSGNAAGSLNSTNNNSAMVANDVGAGADTGTNSATSQDGNASIGTGNATAGANVVNQVNQNLFGGTSMMILIRVHGNWNGNVFSTPPGVSWQETPLGIQLVLDPQSGAASSNTSLAANPNFSENLTSSSTASIANNIHVFALTGDNHAAVSGGTASIQTGNAKAVANVVNIANTNVVGRNWLLAIINIFGDWSGNVAFGRPDLWIGGRVQSNQNTIGKNGDVTYHFTVRNRGDADATNVHLKADFDHHLLRFMGQESTPNVFWDLHTIPAGKTIDVSYDARTGTEMPFGDVPILTTATVSSYETDNNQTDNTEVLTLVASNPHPSGGITGGDNPYDPGTGTGSLTPDPNLVLTKINDASGTLAASSTVKYTITINNESDGPAYNAILSDNIKNGSGNIIHTQQWNLGEIAPHENITVNYTVLYNASTTQGVYTNTASIAALAGSPSVNPFYGSLYNSNQASSQVAISDFPGDGSTSTSNDVGNDSATTTVSAVSGDSATSTVTMVDSVISQLKSAVSGFAAKNGQKKGSGSGSVPPHAGTDNAVAVPLDQMPLPKVEDSSLGGRRSLFPFAAAFVGSFPYSWLWLILLLLASATGVWYVFFRDRRDGHVV